MSAPHDPYQAPTTVLPVVGRTGPSGSPRLKILGAITAATVVIVSVAVWAISSGGDDEQRVAAPIAVASSAPVTAEPTAEATDEATEEPSARPSPTPSRTTAAPARTPAARPGQLIRRLGVVIDALEEQDELDDGDARTLRRRLRDVQRRIDRGDREEAVDKLEDFTEKLEDLREDDDLSETGFAALSAGADQLAGQLSRSGSRDD
ncbi:hypothetical protein [Actinoplanes sp. DH11]|uniref:FIMAH domain-containing protein n=1 Tax=Actinoplanes sp. DH11 TaxID=2857011 RepID=UPI001E44CC59|nr:hypothetical protein [Actinoplanes sp. DH11]